MTVTVTVAPALVALFAFANTRWPGRPKAADGTIGDAAHAARESQHNPNRDPTDRVPDGMVTAADVGMTKVPGRALVAILIRDPRVWYVIHDGFIWSRTHGFEKREYEGAPHDKHVHVSLVQTAQACRDASPWGGSSPKPQPKPEPPKPDKETLSGPRTIQRGDKGELVAALQRFLGVDPATGHFGPLTKAQVKRYQRGHGLVDDGVVGPRTWAVITKALRIPRAMW